ncbi:hypothetical protein EDB83DRAFT_2680451 [Lactarius deliciosus]|nr:hypothetical protein EDB83DRAFT_2680451 [Lactarius deliciosus]
MLHSCAALATQTQLIPDIDGHLDRVSRRAEAHHVSSPDLAAFARGLSSLNPTRFQYRRPPMRNFAPRGSMRDRFRPPDPVRLTISLPDLAAPMRGFSPSTPTRSRHRRQPMHNFVPRGRVRDRLQPPTGPILHFPPQPRRTHTRL